MISYKPFYKTIKEKGISTYKLINTFVMYVKESGNEEYIRLYDRKYFLPSDVVISLDVKEWVELYNKLKFVLRLMNKNNKTTFFRI